MTSDNRMVIRTSHGDVVSLPKSNDEDEDEPFKSSKNSERDHTLARYLVRQVPCAALLLSGRSNTDSSEDTQILGHGRRRASS